MQLHHTEKHSNYIGKLLESIVRDSLLTHFNTHDLLSNNQHGFIPGRSCVTQLLFVLDDWTRAMMEGHNTDVVYFDFSMAFDTVPHKHLIHNSWLSAMPIQKHGFALHKRAFFDAIAFRYGWRPSNLPTTCACGKPFSIDHSLNCPFGGFPTIRHNELRDVTANLLSQICSNVQIEPHLQPLSGETLAHRTSNVDDQARLDISAKGFWNTSHELAFFDVRVFNPLAKSHVNQSLSSCYRKNENEKKRQYEERVRNVEHGTFTPLVFSAAGGMGPITTTFYKRLASLLSEKLHQSYNQTILWLRCSLTFSLLRSVIMCLRGARSSCGRPQPAASDISLAVSEAKL